MMQKINFGRKMMSKHMEIKLKVILLATAAATVSFAALPAYSADEMTQERLLNSEKETGNWLHHHKNYSATRFSSLKEINKDNVKNLKVAWTMHLGGVEGGGIGRHGGLRGRGLGLEDLCSWRKGRSALEDGSQDRSRLGRRGRLLRCRQSRRRSLG